MGEDLYVTVAVSPEVVWALVATEDRMGEWNADWRKHDAGWAGHSARYTSLNKVLKPNDDRPHCLIWSTGGRFAVWGRREWELEVTASGTGSRITGRCTGGCPVTPDMIRADLDRLKDLVQPARPSDFGQTADMLTLLGVYTAQFGSFTTMLWQVPALGLTAQAFLMTIALGSPISDDARVAASVLSVIIAGASQSLMHSQRGRAINQAELAKRVSVRLGLKQFLGNDFALDDAVPRKTNARDVWDVDHRIYAVWKVCMVVFAIVDAVVILAVLCGWQIFLTRS